MKLTIRLFTYYLKNIIKQVYLLKPEKRQEIIDNLKLVYNYNIKLKSKVIHPVNSILVGFVWVDTPQGEQYWKNIYTLLHNIKSSY